MNTALSPVGAWPVAAGLWVQESRSRALRRGPCPVGVRVADGRGKEELRKFPRRLLGVPRLLAVRAGCLPDTSCLRVIQVSLSRS